MTNLGLEYASAARRALARATLRDCTEEIERARTDPNFFCEWTFKDTNKGTPIIQGAHHREWQSLVDEHKRLVMWFPIEHGKTTQAKMKLCRMLGENPACQYGYISSKDKQARKVLAAVKREIEANDRLHLVYPNLTPQISAISRAREEWGNTSIRVAGCPAGAKDPSLSAFGLDGQILGTRLHGVILDNILDAANTRSTTMREWVFDVILDEIIGRVMDGGFIWILDTAWFHDDALHRLAKMPGWHAVKFDAEQPISAGADTLWPQQWPRKRLDSMRETLGPTKYDRQFRNRPISESQDWFRREYWDACYGSTPWLEAWPCDEQGAAVDGLQDMRTGVDLATRKGEHNDLSVFTTVTGHGARRRLHNIQSGKMEVGEILRRIVSIYRAFHKPINAAGGNAKFVVEDNAAQAYVVQMVREAGAMQAFGLTASEAGDIRVVGRTTTVKRRDMELGIPGVASAFEMGRWKVPANAECEALREEMRTWSPEADHYGDRLMSLWIAGATLPNDDENAKVVLL